MATSSTYERLAGESSNYGNRPSTDSSDSEEEHLLEKEGPLSPGLAERGPLAEDEGGEGLIIGGKRQRAANSLRALIICLGLLITLASKPMQPGTSSNETNLTCRLHWLLRCPKLYARWLLSSARYTAPRDGSHIQWYICCSHAELALGTRR